MLYQLYSTAYVRHTLYSAAHDNGDSFSLSYTRNKANKMQSTINHRKGRAVHAIMALVPLLRVQHFLHIYSILGTMYNI